MQRPDPSTRLLAALVGVLALLSAAGVFLPRGVPGAAPPELPAAPWVVALVSAVGSLVVYGGLGWVGLRLSRTLGYPEPVDPAVPPWARLGLPLATGVALGGVFILADTLAARLHGLGPLPHPPFPTSLVASVSAAIGEEVLFRLFFIPFWVWALSRLPGIRPGSPILFWSVAVASGLAFTAAHLPSVLFLHGVGTPTALPVALLLELLALNGALSLVAAWHLRRHGFLAAVGVHFWTDVVWHVLWGAF